MSILELRPVWLTLFFELFDVRREKAGMYERWEKTLQRKREAPRTMKHT